MNLTQPIPGVTEVQIPVPLPVHFTNCYVIDTGGGLVVIDAGMDTPSARQTWDDYLTQQHIKPGAVRFLFVTHSHPDHLGLADWLSKRLETPVAMMAGEAAYAQSFRQRDGRADANDFVREFYRVHGVPLELVEHWISLDAMFREAIHLPTDYDAIADGEIRTIGDVSLTFIEQGGHTAHQGLVYLPQANALFTGDQVLERISPNVSLWPGGRPDPLHDYLSSLARLEALPHPLGLPAHEHRIPDVTQRVQELYAHHQQRNRKLSDLLHEGPLSAYTLTRLLFTRPLDDYQLRFALGETLAHLAYLHQEGAVMDQHDGDTSLYALR